MHNISLQSRRAQNPLLTFLAHPETTVDDFPLETATQGKSPASIFHYLSVQTRPRVSSFKVCRSKTGVQLSKWTISDQPLPQKEVENGFSELTVFSARKICTEVDYVSFPTASGHWRTQNTQILMRWNTILQISQKRKEQCPLSCMDALPSWTQPQLQLVISFIYVSFFRWHKKQTPTAKISQSEATPNPSIPMYNPWSAIILQVERAANAPEARMSPNWTGHQR